MPIDESSFDNVYGDQQRADSYAKLQFPNTYYLAYRDLPQILTAHVEGKEAVDFGCGTGRSTRFLKSLGFSVIGIDISEDMLAIARRLDPGGMYKSVANGNYGHLGARRYDLVQSIFTFDNIPGWQNRTNILVGLRELLKPSGTLICLDSTPELYTHEWASFSTKDFPENWGAQTGDTVRDIMLDVEDRRPVEDIFWTIVDYQKLFHDAGFEIVATYKPLGYAHEPYAWVSECELAPWVIFVLASAERNVSVRRPLLPDTDDRLLSPGT
jgi:SAM-dependent methyltransferase